MGKYLGIDYGKKRIGVAISDEEGNFAFPKGEVGQESFRPFIEETAQRDSISGVVFGISAATNGKENDLDEEIKKVAKSISHVAPIFFQQEMFSSFEAHRYQTNKGAKDASAAAIILQRFLDKQKK